MENQIVKCDKPKFWTTSAKLGLLVWTPIGSILSVLSSFVASYLHQSGFRVMGLFFMMPYISVSLIGRYLPFETISQNPVVFLAIIGAIGGIVFSLSLSFLAWMIRHKGVKDSG